MSGILIYSQEQAKRNTFAVEKFKKYLGVRLVDESYDGDPDFVINRTNDYKIAQRFEDKGIRVFNPSHLSRLANNKQMCYEFMEKNGIPIMPVNYTGVPAVKKIINGHGGNGVTMITAPEPFEENYVYQKPCDTLGRDLRIWVVGGEIVASIMRESHTDFRSNYCLGGTATVHKLSKGEEQLAKRVISLVKSDYIGIDFIYHQGQPIFNEIEDTVGARMLYDKTDIDILKIYCEYIKEHIKKESRS